MAAEDTSSIKAARTLVPLVAVSYTLDPRAVGVRTSGGPGPNWGQYFLRRRHFIIQNGTEMDVVLSRVVTG